jgi:hypothetical protein
MTEKTLADAIREEEERARRRFVHHTRPKGPLSLQEAIELCERVAGEPPPSAFIEAALFGTALIEIDAATGEARHIPAAERLAETKKAADRT